MKGLKNLIKELFNSTILFFLGGAFAAFYLHKHVSASWLGAILSVAFLILVLTAALDAMSDRFKKTWLWMLLALMAASASIPAWFYIIFSSSTKGLAPSVSVMLVLAATLNMLIGAFNLFQRVIAKEEIYRPAVGYTRA